MGFLILLICCCTMLVLFGSIMGIIAVSRIKKLDDKFRSLGGLVQFHKRMDNLNERLCILEKKLTSPRPVESEQAKEKPVAYSPAKPTSPHTPPPPIPKTHKPPVNAATAAPAELSTEITNRLIDINFEKSDKVTSTHKPSEPTKPQTLEDHWARFEETAGRKWLSWGGILVFFISVALFLKHAFDNNWINPNPTAQIISACCVGLIMLLGGLFYARGKYIPFGQSLVGGGLMILYAALFCAYSPHVYKTPVIASPTTAFALMCVITAIGITIAVILDAQVIAALATIGGFLTPVLVSTGIDSRDILFSYLLLLDLGILAASIFRRWRFMDVTGFVATSLLYVIWFQKFYVPSMKTPAMLWLGAFYTVFLIVPFIYNFVHKQIIEVERFVLSNANAASSFAMSWFILEKNQQHLSWAALSMAVIYTIMALIANKRITEDRLSKLALTVVAMAFAVIFVPLQFTGDIIAILWAVMACVGGFMGMKFLYRPMQVGAFTILVLALARMIIKNLPLGSVADETIFLNSAFLIPLFIAAGGFVFAFIIQFTKDKDDISILGMELVVKLASGLTLVAITGMEIARFIDTSGLANPDYIKNCQWLALFTLAALAFCAAEWRITRFVLRLGSVINIIAGLVIIAKLYYTGDWIATKYAFLNFRLIASGTFIAAVYMLAASLNRKEMRLNFYMIINIALIGLMNTELFLWLEHFNNPYWTMISLNAALALGALAFCFIKNSMPPLSMGLCSALLGGFIAFVVYVNYPQDYQSIPILNGRFISSLMICLEVFLAGYFLRSYRETYKSSPIFFYWLFAASLLLLLSTEPYYWFSNTITDVEKAKWISLLSVTLVWTIYAAAMLILGFIINRRPIRLIALALFAATALKLLFIDMENVQQGYRIASFMVLGLVMLGASYIYNRAEKFLLQSEKKET